MMTIKFDVAYGEIPLVPIHCAKWPSFLGYFVQYVLQYVQQHGSYFQSLTTRGGNLIKMLSYLYMMFEIAKAVT